MRLRFISRTIAAVAVFGLVAGACSSNKTNPSASGGGGNKPVAGGKVVLGAEQYPECINPVTQCASASWLLWDTDIYVLPRAMIWDTAGKPAASPLLAEAPSLTNGELVQSPFTVKFKINPAAVWGDGTKITCDDFAFTRNAIINTKGTYSTTGYNPAPGLAGIMNIDCSDETTAVLQYSAPYADWVDVFGGGLGFILEKAAFPAEKDQVKVDLSKEMQDSIPFTGGPWKLSDWTMNQTVLVPNPNYWVKNSLGKPTYFDQVTIVPRTDTATEINDLLSGAIDAIYPQPDVSQAQQFGSNPSVKFRGDPGQYYEALWFNEGKFPFGADPSKNWSADDAKTVRNGMMWAVDRDKVVQNVITPVDASQSKATGCGPFALNGTFWCDTQPFAMFHYDVNMVNTVMTAGGFAKDSKGFWAKNGQEIAFVYETTMKTRRITTQALLKEGMTAAGFNVTTKVDDATLLFETKLPHGDYQMADFANGAIIDPSPTSNFACDFIPTQANGYSGANSYRWCDPAATALMKQSDSELDPTKRRALLDMMYDIEAQDFSPGVPLYVLPNVTAWRGDKLAGPIGIWNPTPYSGFYNIQDWYCVRAGACG
jgi:peptide/nickel transport system substrate-binding protein